MARRDMGHGDLRFQIALPAALYQGGRARGADGRQWQPAAAGGTLVAVPTSRAPRRRAAVLWLPSAVPALQALLEDGHATRGLAVTVRGGHLVLAPADALGPDPRFRLTPLGTTTYGLSLYRRRRWEPLPVQGTLQALVGVLNTDLQHWAADWP